MIFNKQTIAALKGMAKCKMLMAGDSPAVLLSRHSIIATEGKGGSISLYTLTGKRVVA